MNNTAREHLEFIRKTNGSLRPADVLADARNPNSPLHSFFTWDNTEAANAFRLIQADRVIKVAVRFLPTAPRRPLEVRIAAQSLMSRSVVTREPRQQEGSLRRRILEAVRQKGLADVAWAKAREKSEAHEELIKSLRASYPENKERLQDEILIVEWYLRGIPSADLADVMQNTSEDPAAAWTASGVEALAAELAINRPDGWSQARAETDWGDNKYDPSYDLYGVPRFSLEPKAKVIGGSDREQGGSLRRFRLYSHHEPTHDREAASLRHDHPALEEARTQFPTRVFDADTADHVLMSGHHNAKVGAYVTKGPWRGMDIFTLTLEERKTCPTSCHLWSQCYGNALFLAKRWSYSTALMVRLNEELREKGRNHPAGFVVRLHILGDFPDTAYATEWMHWLVEIPQLHVFGYTAHPADSEIGRILRVGNERMPDRFAIRFSVPPETEPQGMQATTIWRKDRGRVAEGLVCPASSSDTEACGTCGLCWHPGFAGQRVVFLGHGMSRKGRHQENEASLPEEVEETAPPALETPPPVTRQAASAIRVPLPHPPRNYAAEQVKWPDVLSWMAENKLKLSDFKTKGELLTRVNEIRASHDIPPWEIVEPNGKVVRGKTTV